MISSCLREIPIDLSLRSGGLEPSGVHDGADSVDRVALKGLKRTEHAEKLKEDVDYESKNAVKNLDCVLIRIGMGLTG